MTQILAFAGPKQSGKTSGAHFVSAYVISQIARLNANEPMFKTFDQNEYGKIIIPVTNIDANGNKTRDSGIFDFSRRDASFAEYASEYIWPYVKIYSFAESLKEIAVTVFGIPREQIYGTNAQKELPTSLKWDDFPADVSNGKRGFISGRDFMKAFGTDICRKICPTVWIDSLLRRINSENSDIAIVDDCRFMNEVNTLKQAGAKVIKLDRVIDDDVHPSEVEIKQASPDNFDRVIYNRDITLNDKNQQILDYLYEIGWFNTHIGLENV